MRLIDADALKEFYGKWSNKHTEFLKPEVDIYIDRQPTIDAVPVVRCKDCKRCDGFPEPDDIQPNEIGICRINMLAVKPEGFCSYGERKNGER